MGYPVIYIHNSEINKKFSDSYETLICSGLQITYKKQYKSKVIIVDNDAFLLFAHVNVACEKNLLILGNRVNNLMTDITSIIPDLHWGFIFFLNKQTNQFILYNDIYGIYPVYYSNIGDDFIISNDYDGLLRLQKSISFDAAGLYDYFLFNYTLNSKTLIKNIFQLKGGSVMEGDRSFNNIKINKRVEVSDFLQKDNTNPFDTSFLNHTLSKHISNNINQNLPVELMLSGGFDSKVIMSHLLNQKVDFSSITYGLKGSVDLLAAQNTAKQFDIPNRLLDLELVSLDEMETMIKDFIKCSPGMPLILDLISYGLIKKFIPSSNILTGFMGGELINGPVIVSEVLLTRSARTLTNSTDPLSLKSRLVNDLKSNPIISVADYGKNAENHVFGLENYIHNSSDSYHKNLISFLLNETYAKFFGVVFRNLFGDYNMINPFLDISFLSLLMNSKYRFTRHLPFSKNPVSHLNSRRLYPKMIKRIHEPVIYSPLDRNFVMADLLYLHRLPITVIKYLENHFLNKNKINHVKNVRSASQIRLLIMEKLYKSPILEMDFVEKIRVNEFLKMLNSDVPVPEHYIRKLTLLLSLHYLNEEYKINY